MKIVTHSGNFHADEVFALACIELLYSGAEIVRTRDREVIKSADMAVDVGLINDPSIKRYDHHQSGGAGVRENGIPYASFGLIWKEYGAKLCESSVIATEIEERLVMHIDALDNGVETYKTIYDGVYPYDISSIINSYIPEEDESDIDTAFRKAVDFAKDLLSREISKARVKVQDGVELLDLARKNGTDQLLVLPRFIRGKSVLAKFPGILYIVFPGRKAWDDNNWYLKAVPKNETGFEVKKPLPTEWAGKEEEGFSKVSGVEDAVFCHRGRFLAAAKSKDGAIKLAKIALDA